VGRRAFLNVWGNDYATPDGTGVRDYIHVVDLALGHSRPGKTATAGECLAVNLGTGVGYSVLEMVRAFGKPAASRALHSGAASHGVTYPRATLIGSGLALLGWRAERGLDAMCADAWHWQSTNPNGYGVN